MRIKNNFNQHEFDYDPTQHTIIIGENGSEKTAFLDWVNYGRLNLSKFEDDIQDINSYESWFTINNSAKNNKKIEIVNNILDDNCIFNYTDLRYSIISTNDKYHIYDLLKDKYNFDVKETKLNHFGQGHFYIVRLFGELILFLEECYLSFDQYIMTIDYIEDSLSLHYQQNIMQDLIDLVKDYNIKLLVTTHSPEIYTIVNHPAYKVNAINFSE